MHGKTINSLLKSSFDHIESVTTRATKEEGTKHFTIDIYMDTKCANSKEKKQRRREYKQEIQEVLEFNIPRYDEDNELTYEFNIFFPPTTEQEELDRLKQEAEVQAQKEREIYEQRKLETEERKRKIEISRIDSLRSKIQKCDTNPKEIELTLQRDVNHMRKVIQATCYETLTGTVTHILKDRQWKEKEKIHQTALLDCKYYSNMLCQNIEGNMRLANLFRDYNIDLLFPELSDRIHSSKCKIQEISCPSTSNFWKISRQSPSLVLLAIRVHDTVQRDPQNAPIEFIQLYEDIFDI